MRMEMRKDNVIMSDVLQKLFDLHTKNREIE